MTFSIKIALDAIEKNDHATLMSQPLNELTQWRSQKQQSTFLHQIARHGSPSFEVLDWLLGGGLDINGADKDGDTPLLCIFDRPEHESLAWMKLFLDRGADINLANNNFFTPVMTALTSRKMKCVSLSLNRGAARWIEHTPWEASVEGVLAATFSKRLGQDAIAPLALIDRLSPPTSQDRTRGLFVALAQGKWNQAQFYLANGADALALNATKSTALHMTAMGCLSSNATAKQDHNMVVQIASLGVDGSAVSDLGVRYQGYLELLPDLREKFNEAVAMGSACHLANQASEPVGVPGRVKPRRI